MRVLVGSTGLIGQTIQDHITFDLCFSSQNIGNYVEHDLNDSTLYLSCLPATKWMVNQNIIADINNINSIFALISRYRYKKVVLFSTIDVYNDTPIQVDERTHPTISKLCYGSNRYLFELMVKTLNCSDIQIYRLPALFGNRIKKNVLFDLLHNHNINSININSYYQWFNLAKLVPLISKIDAPGTYNLFTEPVSTREIVKLCNVAIDHQDCLPIIYDYKTILHSSGYIQDSNSVLDEIKNFLHEFSSKPSSF
jgi:hypothetical protein